MNKMSGRWVVALVLGCSSPQVAPAPVRECVRNEECAARSAGLVCVDERCRACRLHAECGPAQTCLRGACRAGAGVCDGDDDCLVNQRCDAHQCTARTECDEHTVCPAGAHCVTGRCVPEAVQAPTAACDLAPPHFAHADSALDDDARERLRRAAGCMRRDASARYRLVGRCDPSGTTEFNDALGERRARNVEAFLIALGVGRERLMVESGGAVASASEEAWPENRRVDIVVLEGR